MAGHTFLKLLEMVPGADIMHGEAVNVDGFFCVVLSYLRGYIDMDNVRRIFNCMRMLDLPTNSPGRAARMPSSIDTASSAYLSSPRSGRVYA